MGIACGGRWGRTGRRSVLQEMVRVLSATASLFFLKKTPLRQIAARKLAAAQQLNNFILVFSFGLLYCLLLTQFAPILPCHCIWSEVIRAGLVGRSGGVHNTQDER